MKKIAPYFGPIFLLLGVFILAIHFFLHSTSNNLLLAGGVLMGIGILGHIVLNKIYY